MSRPPTAEADPPRRGADARAAAGRVLLVLGAGAAVGGVIGGIGGRLVMFVLRTTSDADGVKTDAGAEIGRVTVAGTLSLIVVTAAIGVIFAVLYSVARPGIPAPARVPAAGLVGGTLGGTSFLDPEGLDLLILEPLWFAVASFIVLPATAAVATALVLERVARRHPWPQAWRASPTRELALTGQVIVSGFTVLLIAAQGTELIDVISRIP